MDFAYPAEKFSTARRVLMLPHPRGEALSIVNAFHECSNGLHRLPLETLDDSARSWVRTLDQLMDTTGLSDPDGMGLWYVRAEGLSDDEKIELSSIIDELAHWFRRAYQTA